MYFIILLMLALSFRLATLTIVHGDYYRDISDNKRLKEIYITAPRGEIRDRYGRLLAGNKPSFTVQLLKDELNIKDKHKKNDALLSLIRLLETDGVNYLSDFPIDLNVFKYKSEEDYLKEDILPEDKVIEIIIENNLLGEFLYTFYKHPYYEDHYEFTTVTRAINALNEKGIDVPIEVNLEGKDLLIRYMENEDVDKWLSRNNLQKDISPIEAITRLIDNDKNIIRKIVDHPLSRKLAYDLIKSKGLEENIIVEEYSLKFDEEYKAQKRTLMGLSDKVKPHTTAKEDFVNIFVEYSLHNLLERVIVKEGEEDVIVPGKILIDLLIEKGKKEPVSIEVSEDKDSVIYKFTEGHIVDEKPLERLIELAKESNVLEEFVSMDIIKPLAQDQLLKDGINTRISIANDFEYVFINNKRNWFNGNKIDLDSTAKEALEKLKQRYDIPEELSPYETRSILSMYELLNKQGHLAYQPINIAYGIKDTTVAKIEENLGSIPGIQVSIEPVRYYPEGTTAAHILGYLGKISQPNEIKKYVEEKNYSPNDIIGKTGIEESFEDVLRGQNGVKTVEVDNIGNTTNVLSEIKPVSGNNVYLTIDLDLQKFVENALKETLEQIQVAGTYKSKWGDYKFGINRKKGKPYENANSGAVVVLNVKTGEVLSMVSYPAYDPNLFSTGISNSDWQSLFPENEKDQLAPRPLYNIATQSAVQPGSTYKMVTALAALEKGLSPTYRIRDMGKVDIGSKPFGCWIWNQSRGTHGYVNLYDALRDSCNYYFYTLALGRNQKTGENIGVKLEIEDIINLSKQLGLNDKTGIEINVPAESSGGVPNPQREILTTKALLKSYLQRNIRNYIKEGITLDDKEIEDIIEEIASWTELEETLTRAEVVRRLNEFGIDPEKRLPNEREGLADKIKYTYLEYAGWKITDTLNVTIGQGRNAYTPIQMANYIATIANGGYRHKITLIDNVKNHNNSKVLFENQPEYERIELNDYNNLEHIKLGMLKVTTEGTARSVFSKFPIKVGAKTGTAQHTARNPVTGEVYDDFAWFVAFAPYDDPEIAVAAVLFQGGSGGYAGPMVRDIIAEYFGLNKESAKEPLPFVNTLAK